MHSTTIEPPLAKAQEAFSKRQLIRVLKTNGQILEAGHIIIMYGDVAFRIQPELEDHDSQFIRVSEVSDIQFEDR
jgi:hypothetical protein